MPSFIPVDKIKKLREAAKTGDERAKKILSMQLGGKEDFWPLMDEYFAPKQEVSEQPATDNSLNPKLEEFLSLNGITKDSEDYQEYVDDFNRENGIVVEKEETCECEELIKKLIKEEIDAIKSYGNAIAEIMECESIDDNKKRKIISRFEEIKSDESEHRTELLKILELCKSKADENNDETI